MGLLDFASNALGRLREPATGGDDVEAASYTDAQGWNDCESCGRDMTGSDLTQGW